MYTNKIELKDNSSRSQITINLEKYKLSKSLRCNKYKDNQNNKIVEMRNWVMKLKYLENT